MTIALAGCSAGDSGLLDGEGRSAQQTSAFAEGSQIFGLHDSGGQFLMGNAGRKGWVVYSEVVGDTKFHAYDTSHGALVRLNWGYGSTGTLPCDGQYDAYAQAAATFVQQSSGANIWVIANEANLSAEWPLCDTGSKDANGHAILAPQVITPDRYVRAFRKARAAIRGVAGHGADKVVMLGTAFGTLDPGMNWVQYYEAILDELGQGGVDGIALHTYSRDPDPAHVALDNKHTDDHRRWGFRAYQDYLEATPYWARSLPVYITETDQNAPWPDQNNGWVQAAYSEINAWNFGPTSAAHQKVQALALYRWNEGAGKDPFNFSNKLSMQQDFIQAMAHSYPAPTAVQPAESTANECSVENLGVPAYTPQETGYTLSGRIQSFWNGNGGLAIFGFPISSAHRVVNSSGSYVCSQLFERHRIEVQLNDDDTVKFIGSQPYVTLGRVGAERMTRDQDLIDSAAVGYGASGGNANDCQTFAEVPYKICGQLKAYWNQYGLTGGNHLGLFGFPQSAPFTYRSDGNKTYTAQYFERARIELHPEDPSQPVKGGLLGAELKFGDRR